MLISGLILVWLGVFFFLAQMGAIPAHVWWVYFIAGLGGACFVGGLLGSLPRRPVAREGLGGKPGEKVDTGEKMEDLLDERATQLEAEVKALKVEVAKKRDIAKTRASIDESINEVKNELIARIEAGETAKERALRGIEQKLMQTRSELQEFDRKVAETQPKSLENVKPMASEVAEIVGTRQAKTFSGQLGVEHSAIVGRKILLEFDPSTPYEKAIKDFAMECASNNETVIILTPRGSAIRRTVEGHKGVDIIDLTPDTMMSPILQKHAERPLNFVYDSLSDLALSTDSRRAYRFTLDSLKLLSDSKISAIFLLNPSAHDSKDVGSLRGLFSNQVSYGKRGLSRVKFG